MQVTVNGGMFAIFMLICIPEHGNRLSIYKPLTHLLAVIFRFRNSIEQYLTNYILEAKSNSPSYFVNKVVLEYGHFFDGILGVAASELQEDVQAHKS